LRRSLAAGKVLSSLLGLCAELMYILSRKCYGAHMLSWCTYAEVVYICWADAHMLTYADVCWHMLTYADICWCLHPYADACCHMLMYVEVCWRTLTFADVRWRLLTHAHVFWRMLTVADNCWRMLTYADVCCVRCWRMLTYADVCWSQLTYADVCWRMLTYADDVYWFESLTGCSVAGVPLGHKGRQSSYCYIHVLILYIRVIMLLYTCPHTLSLVWLFIGTQKRLVALHSALDGSRRDGLLQDFWNEKSAGAWPQPRGRVQSVISFIFRVSILVFILHL
jgi:hypothetical protein